MNYFRLAFTHAHNQSFSLPVLLQICRGAWTVDSTETLSWLTDILKKRPKDQPSHVLFETVSQVFSPGTDPYRQLKAIWEIQHLALLCEQVNALKSKLNALDFSA
jgi:hypothetical protein